MTDSNYDLSNFNLGPGSGRPAPQPGKGFDPHQSLREMTPVDLPLRQTKSRMPPGRGLSADATVETVKLGQLGPHIADRVERGLRVSHIEASNILAHFCGALKGMDTVNAESMGHLEKLSRQFAASSDPPSFYKTNVKPFLFGLKPIQR